MMKLSVKLKSVAVGAMLLSGALFIPGVASADISVSHGSSSHGSSSHGSSSHGSSSYGGLGGYNRGVGSISNFAWHFKRGVKAFESGDLVKAKRIFSDLGGHNRGHARSSVNFYMARIKSMQGDNKGALLHYSAILRRYPNTYSIMAGMGENYAKLGRWDEVGSILSRLEAAAGQCAVTCENASVIDVSIEVVKKALADKA